MTMPVGAALQVRIAAAVAAPFGGIEIESDGESITGLRFVRRARVMEPAHELAATPAVPAPGFLHRPAAAIRPPAEGARHRIPAPRMAVDRGDPLRRDSQLRRYRRRTAGPGARCRSGLRR